MSIKKQILLAASLLALSACSTVPPVVAFPAPPEILMLPAQSMGLLPDNAPLSEIARSVIDNYGTCNANATQLHALQKWVRKQQNATK